MQSRTLPLLFIALLCGLGAAYLAWHYSGGNKADQKIKVLVPKQDIPAMSKLDNPELFIEQDVSVNSLRQGDEVIKIHEEVKDMKSKDFVLFAGKPIYKSDVVLDKLSGVKARLMEDEVAHSLPVNPSNAGQGFITVGDRVDLICQVPSRRNDALRYGLKFQNIEVLAVNQTGGTTPGNEPQPPRELLLRMKRIDSPKLEQYIRLGKVTVVLRKAGYDEIVTVPDVEAGSDVAGSNTAEDRGLLASPGLGAPGQDPEVPPPPVAEVPPPQPVQPEPIPVVEAPPAPPPPPKTLPFKTEVVVAGKKFEINHEIPNPAYKPGEEKDGKIDEKPKADAPAPGF